MSNLFYSLTPLVAGTLRVYSVGVMPPDDLTPRISKGGGIVQARLLTEGDFLEDTQLHHGPRERSCMRLYFGCPDQPILSLDDVHDPSGRPLIPGQLLVHNQD